MIQSHNALAWQVYYKNFNGPVSMSKEYGSLVDFCLSGLTYRQKMRENIIHLQIEQMEDRYNSLDSALYLTEREPSTFAFELLEREYRVTVARLLTLRAQAFRLSH